MAGDCLSCLRSASTTARKKNRNKKNADNFDSQRHDFVFVFVSRRHRLELPVPVHRVAVSAQQGEPLGAGGPPPHRHPAMALRARARPVLRAVQQVRRRRGPDPLLGGRHQGARGAQLVAPRAPHVEPRRAQGQVRERDAARGQGPATQRGRGPSAAHRGPERPVSTSTYT
ncbi:hypothetical protein FOCC_FOCC000850 [Frankliniella occidentalis]|nr:hypothetical protein FOCC_FOCC000850 [Frankliniella occidentalis]